MSISGSLSSAISGLTANARAAEIVASNIANALTEGYGRRELVTAPRQIGGGGQGVTVVGVMRRVDQALIGDRRLADASAGQDRTRSEFLGGLERAIGNPLEEQSLSGRIAAFDTALLEASSRPESEARLARLADTALALTSHLAAISSHIQAARLTADNRIDNQVQQLNAALVGVDELNDLIRANSGSGRDTSALMDQRQQLIDKVAAIVPLREVARDHEQVALFTAGGAILVDGQVARFGFLPVGQITYGMTKESGALSGLTLDDKPIATSGDTSLIAGGTLSADFFVRDQLAPDAQAQIDALARDVIERFAAPGLDSTRTPGSAGLFTDGGSAFDLANEAGLSQRLQLNARVDPQKGGALWRLRDGLGAATRAAEGDAQLIVDLQTALTERRAPASSVFTTGDRSFAALAADLLSSISVDRLTADGEASYSQARTDALRALELSGGVDSDQEIQNLLQIEQNFAANAKVVQTVDAMIQTLLGI